MQIVEEIHLKLDATIQKLSPVSALKGTGFCLRSNLEVTEWLQGDSHSFVC